MASTQADLDYDLFTLLQSFYITTAEGLDLDIRGNDYQLARDPGQSASGTVTVTRVTSWVDDIPFPAATGVQATLPDGSTVLYRSIADASLHASGRSVSGAGPNTTLTSGVNDRLVVNVNGDGPRTLTLGTQASGAGIAAAIQAAMRALTANNATNQAAYNTFRVDYSVTVPGAYTLRSGTAGAPSSVVVTVAGSLDASASLKLGVANGGTEQAGFDGVALPVICDQLGTVGNVGAGQVNQLSTAVAGVATVGNLLAFANGRDPASDDAYRQDIRNYLLSLGRGTQRSLERAVAQTRSADGLQHVLSSQVLYGAGTIAVYISDGRSLTVGAQPDVILDVQNELDGLGEEPGGWVPSGNRAGVASAFVIPVNIDVTVVVGPTPDLARAQNAVSNTIYNTLYNWGVGQSLSYAQLATRIDQVVSEVLDITFASPTQFALAPTQLVGGGIGQKVMPGSIVVNVRRA